MKPSSSQATGMAASRRVIGGFAVNMRITHVHRLTNDLDTVSRDQASLVEILVAEFDA